MGLFGGFIDKFKKGLAKTKEVFTAPLKALFSLGRNLDEATLGEIEEVAKNWQLKRMAAIDRNILRLATYELLYREDIPPLVTINEAIDIAKKFSTKNSGPFVNGILDNIRLRSAPPGKQKK